MRELLAGGGIVVVETEDDRYFGTAEVTDEGLVVRSGFVGRPFVIPASEVLSIFPAQGHPDVTA